MPGFSFTAPFITDQQEREERAVLTEAEKNRLEEDIHGGEVRPGEEDDDDDKTMENEIFLLRGAEQMRVELDRLPAESRSAYDEAVIRCPDLVKYESDFVAFYRGAKYDAAAAAKKVANYWTTRKTIFGDEGCFLPMSQRDGGAMSGGDDARNLRLGLFRILSDDEHGRQVLYWDRVRCVEPMITREGICRLFFYHLQVLSEREDAQRDGFVWLVNVKGVDLYRHFDRTLSKKMLKLVSLFPATFCSVHTFCGSGVSVVNLVLPVVKHIGGLYFRLRLLTHNGSDKEIISGLGLYGIKCDETMSSLICRHHRTDEDGAVLSWIAQRRRREEEEAERRRSLRGPDHE